MIESVRPERDVPNVREGVDYDGNLDVLARLDSPGCNPVIVIMGGNMAAANALGQLQSLQEKGLLKPPYTVVGVSAGAAVGAYAAAGSLDLAEHVLAGLAMGGDFNRQGNRGIYSDIDVLHDVMSNGETAVPGAFPEGVRLYVSLLPSAGDSTEATLVETGPGKASADAVLAAVSLRGLTTTKQATARVIGGVEYEDAALADPLPLAQIRSQLGAGTPMRPIIVLANRPKSMPAPPERYATLLAGENRRSAYLDLEGVLTQRVAELGENGVVLWAPSANPYEGDAFRLAATTAATRQKMSAVIDAARTRV